MIKKSRFLSAFFAITLAIPALSDPIDSEERQNLLKPSGTAPKPLEDATYEELLTENLGEYTIPSCLSCFPGLSSWTQRASYHDIFVKLASLHPEFNRVFNLTMERGGVPFPLIPPSWLAETSACTYVGSKKIGDQTFGVFIAPYTPFMPHHIGGKITIDGSSREPIHPVGVRVNPNNTPLGYKTGNTVPEVWYNMHDSMIVFSRNAPEYLGDIENYLQRTKNPISLKFFTINPSLKNPNVSIRHKLANETFIYVGRHNHQRVAIPLACGYLVERRKVSSPYFMRPHSQVGDRVYESKSFGFDVTGNMHPYFRQGGGALYTLDELKNPRLVAFFRCAHKQSDYLCLEFTPLSLLKGWIQREEEQDDYFSVRASWNDGPVTITEFMDGTGPFAKITTMIPLVRKAKKE